MRYVLLIIALLCLTPSVSRAEGVNAGFVQGIWYASSPVFAGEPNRIYVALRNHTDQDLTGTVRFTDNEKRIGVSYINALPGRLVEAWVDWTPTFGEHTIVASLSEIRLHTIGENPETAEVISTLAKDTLTIDYDTDKDGIGNETDTDDDNDGISDTDEKARGSNPLVANPNTHQAPVSEPEENEDDEPVKDTRDERDNSEERGLERYIGEGTIDAVFTTVTKKIDASKQSLDTYREERNERLYSSTTLETISETNATGDTATITRSKIETKGGFLPAFVAGVRTLLESVWTFVLFIFSHILAFPALIELFILIFILYTLYRTARRFGRRNIM